MSNSNARRSGSSSSVTDGSSHSVKVSARDRCAAMKMTPSAGSRPARVRSTTSSAGVAVIDGASASLSLQIARMVEGVRKEELRKVPGVAETLDWAAALVGLEVRDLHDVPEAVFETMMCLLKTREDRARITREVTERLLGKVA